ncbi:MAG: hypothetical protein JXA03_01845 [Bacteroidales bacterium]|nr:hypothetical protein [Bacteroidales bacterium]
MIKLLILYFFGRKLAPGRVVFNLIKFYLIAYLLILPGLLVSHTLNRQGDNTYYAEAGETDGATALMPANADSQNACNFVDYSETHINCLSRSF